MSGPLTLRPDAVLDVEDAFRYLSNARTGVGPQFLARLREVLERVESFPELYGIVWQDVRAARLKQFRYVVYFVVFQDRIEVLAVLHNSRAAGVWQSRA